MSTAQVSSAVKSAVDEVVGQLAKFTNDEHRSVVVVVVPVIVSGVIMLNREIEVE